MVKFLFFCKDQHQPGFLLLLGTAEDLQLGPSTPFCLSQEVHIVEHIISETTATTPV